MSSDWYDSELDDEIDDPIFVYDPVLDDIETDDTLDIEDDLEDSDDDGSLSPMVLMEVMSPALNSSPERDLQDLEELEELAELEELEDQEDDLSSPSSVQSDELDQDSNAAQDMMYVLRNRVHDADLPVVSREEEVRTYNSPRKNEVEPMAGCSKQPEPGAADRSMADDDGQICTICFEPWTNTSDHRLVSLRCGHLFGRSCISRWLRGQNARCPQCNARARKSEIRNIYAKSVKVLDTTERDRALADLALEVEKRRKAEMEAAQERLRCDIKNQECANLRRELTSVQRMLKEYKTGTLSQRPQSYKPVPIFSLEKMIPLCKTGNCLKVGVSSFMGMLAVTMPSSNKLFSGEGFTKLSTVDFKAAEFVLVHQKCIKDLEFHPHDGMVLTASFDKTCKITNVLTNSVAQTYHLKDTVWSCTWDLDDPVNFYAGTQTGDVYQFDIRVTDKHVKVLPQFGKRAPVATISYLKNSQHQRISGPVVGTLVDSAFFMKEKGEYSIVPVQNLGPITCVSTEPTSGNFLLSCRPSVGPNVTHTVCDIVQERSDDSWRCTHVQTLLGGRSQVKLTKSKLMPHPNNPSSLLVAAGDEESGGALLWDASSGQRVDHFKTESPVVDFAHFKINQQSLLFALTTENLRVYKYCKP